MVFEESDDFIAILFAVSFDGPPEQQRHPVVRAVFGAPGEGLNQCKAVPGRQSFGRGGELISHFQVRFFGGQRSEFPGSCRRNTRSITQQSHRPEPNERIGMIEGTKRFDLGPATRQVQRPQGFQRDLTGVPPERLGKSRRERGLAPIAQQAQRRLAHPAVGMIESL